MGIVLVGLNHKSAPVELRERLAVPLSGLKGALEMLRGHPRIQECVLISTCNRTEVVAASGAVCQAKEAIEAWFAAYGSLSPSALKPHTYGFFDQEAVEHLFAVASGLDSLVVGEPQVLGQVKESYRQASLMGSVGPSLHSLFHTCFRVAKRIRSETGLGEGNVSVPSTAVELACQIFSRMEDRNVLVIGAGEMGRVAAKHFKDKGVGGLFVANRTIKMAEDLAVELDGVPLALEKVHEVFPKMDIILSAVSVDRFLLKEEDLVPVIKRRSRGPLLLLDIALPRSIDPGVQSLTGVYLYHIDDLNHVVEANLKSRESKAKEGMSMVSEEARAFMDKLDRADIDGLIAALRNKLEELRCRELQRTLSKLKGLSDKDRQALEILTVSLLDKFLHDPVMTLKNGTRDSIPFLSESLARLFQLDVFPEGKAWKESESPPAKALLP